MRRALAGCLALSLAGPPLGVLLVLRRMSLTSDVLQHGMLPGVALGALVGGLRSGAMGLGGVLAGLAVALLAGWLARASGGREDSQLAGVYLVALALGVAIVSATRGVDLPHLLFGSVLAVDDTGAAADGRRRHGGAARAGGDLAPAGAGELRPRLHARRRRARRRSGTSAFMALVVLCVVGGFAALGTLMSVGLMMLPAVAARHFAAGLAGQVRAAVALAVASSLAGLLLSFHADVPAGPAIVLSAGALWLAGLLAGPRDSLRAHLNRPHYRA